MTQTDDEPRIRGASKWIAIALILLVVGSAAGATIGFIPISNNDDGAVLNQPGGPTATLTGNFDAYNDSGSVDSSTIQWNTSEGSIQFSSTAQTSATLDASNIEGTYTTLTSIDASNATLSVDPSDKQQIELNGPVTDFEFADMALDDGNTDFVISGPDGEQSTVTIHDLPADQTITAANQDGNAIAVGTTDASGTLSLDVHHSTHTITLQSGDQSATPQQSNPSPTGDLNTRPDTFSVQINDSDLPDDTVTVEIGYEGSELDTTTIESNGTVSVQAPDNIAGGTHSWYVNTQDQFGNKNDQTYQFSSPDNLTIRDEETLNIIDNSTIKVQYYTRDLVLTKTTDTGQVDFTGAPIDEEFVVFTDTPGYHDRRILIRSLYNQQTIYLLNESANATNVEFMLDDKTGNFYSKDTKLFIRKGVNQSGNTSWQTISGDYFGADGSFPATLERGERYLLTIENDDGDRRDVGYWMATEPEAGIREVTVGEIEPPPVPEDEGYVAQVQTQTKGNDTYILFKYRDSTNDTDSVSVDIYERGKPTNTIHSDSEQSVGQTYYVNASVPSDSNVSTYLVNWTAERDGDTIGQTIPVSVGDSVSPEIPLGAPWPGTLGFILVMFLPTLGGGRYAPEGAVATVAVAGMLMATATITIDPTFWTLGAVVATSMIAVKYYGGAQ